MACKKGGIRRAGEETPQCGVCPPRGAAERGSAGFAGAAVETGKTYAAGLDFCVHRYRIRIRIILITDRDDGMTKYARRILELVEASHGHMTAEQVFDALRQSGHHVALATVYNNLSRLCQEGRIRKVSVAGMPDRYDRTERHDHLVCCDCGSLLDVRLADLTGALEAQLGFSILGYDLKLSYRCAACRARHEGQKDAGAPQTDDGTPPGR